MVKLSENSMPGITVSSLQVSVMYIHFLENCFMVIEESIILLELMVFSLYPQDRS